MNGVVRVGKFRSRGERNGKVVGKVYFDVGIEPQKRVQSYKPRLTNRVSVIDLSFVFYGDGNARFEILYLNFAAEFYLEFEGRSAYV